MVGTSFKAWVEKKRGQNLIFSLTVHDFSGTRVVRAGGGREDSLSTLCRSAMQLVNLWCTSSIPSHQVFTEILIILLLPVLVIHFISYQSCMTLALNLNLNLHVYCVRIFLNGMHVLIHVYSCLIRNRKHVPCFKL